MIHQKKSLVNTYHKYRDLNIEASTFISTKPDDKFFDSDAITKNPSLSYDAIRNTLERNTQLISDQMDKIEKSKLSEALRFVTESSCLVNELNYLKMTYRNLNRKLKTMDNILKKGGKLKDVKSEADLRVKLAGNGTFISN
jgi:hypothetical protein